MRATFETWALRKTLLATSSCSAMMKECMREGSWSGQSSGGQWCQTQTSIELRSRAESIAGEGGMQWRSGLASQSKHRPETRLVNVRHASSHGSSVEALMKRRAPTHFT